MSAVRRLSIVHTESSCGWGGQEIRVLEESAGLAARGHEVRILCPAESRIHAEAVLRGIPATALPIARKNLRGLLALSGWLRRHRPDVINTHSSTDSWLASLAVRTTGLAVPLVRTRHISAPLARNALTRWLYARAASRIVTTGEALRSEVIEATGASPARVASVPSGVDLSRFVPGERSVARERLALPADAFIVGIVATLRSWKGHATLVEALALLADPGVRLVVVGDGPGWEPLHEQVARLGVTEQVIFAGNQADPAPWFQALDLFALPSWANEGVPQAIQQAMACGLAVITTPVGAIAEIVADGQTGLFVRPRDAQALAGALARLKGDGGLRARLGQAGRECALARFSRETMLDRMEAVFADSTAGCDPRSLPVSRMLVSVVARIGDTLLATPAMRAMKQRYPDARLTVFAHPKRVEVLAHLPFIDELAPYTWTRRALDRVSGRARQDIALVYGSDPGPVRQALRNAGRVVAFDRCGLSAGRLQRVAPPELPMHAVRERLLLAQAAGADTDDLRLAYRVTDAERERARGWLEHNGALEGKPLIGLQPCSFPTKAHRDWPLERFRALAGEVCSAFPSARFVILGDRSTARAVHASRFGVDARFVIAAGRLSLRESAALVSWLDAYVGVDTGPTHIAGALGVKMVALYHAAYPGRFLAPLGNPRCAVIEHPRTGQADAATAAMDEIPVEQVWRALHGLLGQDA